MKPKRIISLLVAVCMVVAMLPVGTVTAFAADTTSTAKTFSYEYKGQTLNYKVIDETNSYVELSHNENIKGVVVVPETVTDAEGKTYTVTQIGSDAINNGGSRWNNTPTSIEMPSTIKRIESSAFNNNWSLTGIHIPASVEYIGKWAFQWCGVMTSITFEENSQLKEIAGSAFYSCEKVETICLPDGVEKIGIYAFIGCKNLKEITIPATVKEIGASAVGGASDLVVKYEGTKEQWEKLETDGKIGGNNTTLETKTIFPKTLSFELNGHGNAIDPQTVYDGDKVVAEKPTAEGYNFAGWYSDADLTKKFDTETDTITEEVTTLYAKWEKIPATLTTSTEELTCTVGEPATVEFAIATNGDAGNPAKVSLTVSDPDAVDSLKVNGQTMQDKEFTYSLSHLIGMTGKVEAVFNKAGTYTMTATLAVEGNEPVVRTVEVTVKEKPVEPVVTYDLTVKDGKVKVDGNSVTAGEKGVYEVAENAKVEVTFDQSTLSDAQMFDQWSITPASVLNAVDPKSEAISFTMPAEKVTIEAMTRDATIESDGPGILGTAAMIGVGVAGTAVLGYQGYMIGTELYLDYVLPAGAAIPQNYGELAKLVWNDAGRPEPIALLAADAADEQKALTWAVENQIISADKAADASVGRWEVIDAWNKAQEMKKA